MGLSILMKPTKDSIGKVKDNGGFFYFLCDTKGTNAALMVFDTGKDADGKRTFRQGRGLIKDFKAEFGKPKVSQGKIQAGTPVTFAITKGNVKPAQMKLAFKKSKVLHEGIGPNGIKVVKSAKVTMDAETVQKTKAKNNDGATNEPTPEMIHAFTEREDIKELGLINADEIKALLQAEQNFQRYEEAFPDPNEEMEEIEEKKAEVEAALSQISTIEEEVKTLRDAGKDRAADKKQEKLDKAKIVLAQKNSTSKDPFAASELLEEDKILLDSAVAAGFEILIEQMKDIKLEVEEAEPITGELLATSDRKLRNVYLKYKRANGGNIQPTIESMKQATQAVINRKEGLPDPSRSDLVAQEIRLRGTVRISIEQAKAFPGWDMFITRAGALGMTEGAALALWRPTVQILRMGTHFTESSDALKKYEAEIKQYQEEAIASLRERIRPAMIEHFPKGRKYAFWSGLESIARKFASSKGYVALETTTLGHLFNGLEFFEAKSFPGHWNAVQPLWFELSRSYATQVRGSVHVFARWQGGLFSSAEAPNVPKDVQFKWHALLPKLEVEPIKEGTFKDSPDCKGPQHVYDATGDEGTTKEIWESQIKAGAEEWKKHHGLI